MRRPGRVFKRGRRWWIAYYVHGKERREPGGTESQARARLRARLKEIAAERFIGLEAERLSVDELLDDLVRYLETSGAKSVAKAKSHLRAARRFFGPHRTAEVSNAMIELTRSGD